MNFPCWPLINLLPTASHPTPTPPQIEIYSFFCWDPLHQQKHVIFWPSPSLQDNKSQSSSSHLQGTCAVALRCCSNCCTSAVVSSVRAMRTSMELNKDVRTSMSLTLVSDKTLRAEELMKNCPICLHLKWYLISGLYNDKDIWYGSEYKLCIVGRRKITLNKNSWHKPSTTISLFIPRSER